MPMWRWKRRLGSVSSKGIAVRRDGAVPLVDAALAVLDVRVAQDLVHRVAQRNVLALERPSFTGLFIA